MKTGRKYVRIRPITTLLVWVFLVSACTGEPPFPYEVTLNTVPGKPVPSRSVDLFFQVTSSDNEPVEDVLVTATAFLGSMTLDLGLAHKTSEAGVFLMPDVEMVTGVWGVDVTVWSGSGGSGSKTTTFPLVVKCSGAGAVSEGVPPGSAPAAAPAEGAEVPSWLWHQRVSVSRLGSTTVTLCPAAARCPAMGPPMRPSPMNAIFIICMFELFT